MFLALGTILTGLLIVIYWWIKSNYQYWKKRNIPYIEPQFPFGNLGKAGRTEALGETLQRIYKEYKGKVPFLGTYFFIQPVALILDLDLVKNVLIKDFNFFHDRQIFHNERDDPLSCHLFAIEGQKWKTLRSKLTSTFTSGKMKFMFPTVVEVGERFISTLKTMIKSGEPIEMKDLLARYMTDVIGTCAFGIECNSLKDPNAKFRRMGRRVVEQRRHAQLVQLFMELFTDVARALRMKSENDDVSEFFTSVIKEAIDYREKNNVSRNDLLDLLIKLKNTGSLDGTQNDDGKITFNELAAQAYVFFAAGFETSSTTLSYCLYELVFNEHIQQKARDEINRIVKNHNGQMTYEALMEMKYIHQIIKETLRKYPPVTELIRGVEKDYLVPGTNYILEKNISLRIPIYSIQRDSDIYPDPDKFEPDRFTAEEIAKRHSCSFLPFGEGPRNCIGSRFGNMQSYIGLVCLLKNFKITKSSRTPEKLVFDPTKIILSAKGGLWVNFEEI